VLLDGESVKSCTVLAASADGRDVTTLEGLSAGDPADPQSWHALQRAFRDKHGLQCGFCTPGIVLTTEAFLKENPSPSHEEIREMLAGNLCRCTGYHFIVEAVAEAARVLRESPST
jgi:carbon-monoxide dehydrogenase small subunit